MNFSRHAGFTHEASVCNDPRTRENTMKALLNPWIARLPALLRILGPYAAIELLLPGGSLIALLIWLYRSRRVTTAGAGSYRKSLLSKMVFFSASLSARPSGARCSA